jgi:Inner membrane component of T3SS, cytoplasmic domain
MTNDHAGLAQSAVENLSIFVASGRHKGADLKVTLPLVKNLLIGSHIDCDLVISDDGVAPAHALLFEQSGCLCVSALPGCGEMSADGYVVQQIPAKLTNGMVLKLGGTAVLRVQSSTLPYPELSQSVAKGARKGLSQRRRKITAFASLACIACSVILMGLAVDADHRLSSVKEPLEATGSLTEQLAVTNSKNSAEISSLEEAARQVDRYLADPGVTVVAHFPKKIEVSGTARSTATLSQLEKIQKFLPSGVEISSKVSYPLDKTMKIPLIQDQQISKLAKKILQVAASEQVPYIEIEGGTKIFEGGQLNGYELMKISRNVIVARRDNQIENFKVE